MSISTNSHNPIGNISLVVYPPPVIAQTSILNELSYVVDFGSGSLNNSAWFAKNGIKTFVHVAFTD